MGINTDTYSQKKKIISAVDKILFQKYWAGVIFFTLAAQFLTIIMLCASIAVDYNFHNSAISDLGVLFETEVLFNTSLTFVGILNIVASIFYYKTHKKISILITNVLAGIGAIGAGLIPLDVSQFHSIFALLAFIFFNLQAIFIGWNLDGPIKLIGILLGTVGFIYVVIMFLGDAGNPEIFGIIGHGGSERLIVYPPIIWLIFLGGYLMGETRLYKK